MTSTDTHPARFVDIHALHAIPYSNLNRDDLGTPKTVVYGGAIRTRVSSQCWKRQIRHLVEAGTGDAAVRTRRVAAAVAERLAARGWPSELAAFAGTQVLVSAGRNGLKVEKDREGGAGLSAALLWLPTSALDDLADLAAEYREDLEREKGGKKTRPVLPADEVAALLCRRTGTVDLFGRMVAELPGGGVDGAVQVAHAFTVHAAETEVDYFAAVDDVPAAGGDAGGGHLGVGQFSAGVFYRYACLDAAGLAANLGGDPDCARELTRAFLRAFLAALPTGKSTATAANTIPDLVYVAGRTDRPVSLAAAFEAPVAPAPDGGHGAPARDALARYAAGLHHLWGTDGVVVHGHAAVDPRPLDGLGVRHDTYAGLLDAAVGAAYPAPGVPA